MAQGSEIRITRLQEVHRIRYLGRVKTTIL